MGIAVLPSNAPAALTFRYDSAMQTYAKGFVKRETLLDIAVLPSNAPAAMIFRYHDMPCRQNMETVLGIHDLMVQKRIRGFVPLTYGSGTGFNSGSSSFLR